MSQLPEPAAAPGTAPPDKAPPAPPETAARPSTPLAGSRSRNRLVAGIVVGAVVAGLGGWILGEYAFTGLTPYIAGALFALVVAEVILSVSREHSRITAVAAALCSVGGLGLAVWISSAEGIVPIPIGGWVAIVIGCGVALARGGIRGGGPPKPNSQPS